jgi:hypothetical protein
VSRAGIDGALPIVRYDRQHFIAERFHYLPGEHLTCMAPTGNGKTTLLYQLLDATASERLPAVALVMKPKDDTVKSFSNRAGFRTVRTWPPPRVPWQSRKARGYTVWPRHDLRNHRWTLDHQERVLGYTLVDCYATGNKIIFADELYSLDNELGLRDELVCIWTKGRSMGAGLWGASQKPSHVPLWAYSQATHMFLSWDPDVRAQVRYGEIGGMDPDLIRSGVEQLDEFEWLYIHRKGRQSSICIVSS